MIQQAETTPDIMTLYAKIATQSASMLRAAQQSNWEELCQAEEVCSDLIRQLQTLKQVQRADLDEKERIQHINYLKKILADDAAIRSITEPRLLQLEEFLRAAHNTHKLNDSYNIS